MALRNTGLSQSLQRTTPGSDFNGSILKIFMSRAESHDVGGEGNSATCASVSGVVQRGIVNESQEKGDSGWLGRLSLSTMTVAVQA